MRAGRRVTERRSFAEARAWIDGWPAVGGVETVARGDAYGRVLAAAVFAPHDFPPCDRALFAGYAVRAADTVGAGAYTPLLQPGAVAVGEGGALPAGADAVLPWDLAGLDAAGRVEALSAVAEGGGVERRGQGLRAGAPVLQADCALGSAALALLAELGLDLLPLRCRPRVLLAVGALAPLLAPLIARDGGVVAGSGFPPDLILTSDPESAGTLDIHGLALRPGGGAGFGRRDGVPVVLVPAEPLACLTAYDLLAGRLLRRLGGRAAALPQFTRAATLTRKIVSAIGWVDVVRVRLAGDGAEPLGSAEGGGLVSAGRADGFVIVPAGREGFAPGETVTVRSCQARDDDW